jgi:hypothetical protein
MGYLGIQMDLWKKKKNYGKKQTSNFPDWLYRSNDVREGSSDTI